MKLNRYLSTVGTAAVLLTGMGSAPAQAQDYGFGCINPGGAAIYTVCEMGIHLGGGESVEVDLHESGGYPVHVCVEPAGGGWDLGCAWMVPGSRAKVATNTTGYTRSVQLIVDTNALVDVRVAGVYRKVA
ncbi:hypothetical protein Sipo8835_45115 [Streptomyces ipomoeae]|jgi:hypothetical protein|uniref:Streptomyces killer toxin-like beta/gamma crystallin domain-containing protein n=1 Tax=Streptomyces ipomoeae TaxID=103232 RepID=A0AAE8VTJ9_9ACTN|nr:hypothetical protein [Streptomyces ipomoeae]MDX2823882.1 hypothetical protein [Streptomyces ipomoeae]MDX2876504.1 hypothetical protein [Streptomyces ipomoeae]TQE15642.1 hypothetical protein Sipo8835_45115 [Streptomyces ipomoeae]TQE35850.1 hypothetical protein Sipo7851_13535 [Streptomyces ipomoeae]